jgi:hypothetical protein
MQQQSINIKRIIKKLNNDVFKQVEDLIIEGKLKEAVII